MSVNNITSDCVIDEIDYNFHVSAGPGAGKTHWLIGHIRNVINCSEHLGKVRKVACITYTNVAADTIRGRLGDSSQYTEISTLHSFLYRHIVKPYIGFLSVDFNLEHTLINGHDDHYVSLKHINNWLDNHSSRDKFKHPNSLNQLKKLPGNQEALKNWISSIYWSFNSNQDLELQCKNNKAYYLSSGERKQLSKKILLILSCDLIEYKKSFWKKGILHHDDVLFFSYKLIEKYPFILKVITSKFPYIFIDEYQDTNPIQSIIIDKLKHQGSIIGVVGDKAQSIYGFQGATPNDFDDFSSNIIRKYSISQNRRSTNSIIDVLNYIRKDINQEKYRNIKGILPELIVGGTYEAYMHIKENLKNSELQVLSRNNSLVFDLHRIVNGGISEINPIKELLESDSNTARRNKVICSMSALYFAKNSRFKEAIKEIEKNNKNILDIEERRSVSLQHLFKMTSYFEKLENSSAYDFFLFVKENFDSSISKLTDRGKQKAVYERILYKDIHNQLSTGSDLGEIKTIHKTKGDDFINVMVSLSSEKDLDFILNPKLDANEEHRVYYVALSRAKDRLFISIPNLDIKNENKLSSLFSITRL